MAQKFGVSKILILLKEFICIFCKLILHLKQSTPNLMVYGELGRYSISVIMKVRMIRFWCRILTGKEFKYYRSFCAS